MSHKTSAARRAAFLRAVTETGNQTIAAERACVSRAWVQLHRTSDPEFRRDLEAAVAAAKARLGQAEERRPPSGWGFLDGEELVVKGSNGRRIQIARARVRQWTPRVEDRFLAVLAATCNVKAALAEVGMTAPSAYAHRKRWPGFARRWDQAVEIATIRLELALVQHACNPFSEPDLPDPAPIRIAPRAGERLCAGRFRPGERGGGRAAAPTPVISMTPDEAMHNLNMHQYQTGRLGKRPGGYARRPSFEEAAAKVLRNIDALERGETLSEADKAASEAEYARRRPSSG